MLTLAFRNRLDAALEAVFAFDFTRTRRVAALCIFLAAVGAVIAGEKYLGLSRVGLYWVHHALYGIGFPFAIYSMYGSWRAAAAATLGWSLGNELWTDQLTRHVFDVDWSHLAADFGGFAVAQVVYNSMRRNFR